MSNATLPDMTKVSSVYSGKDGKCCCGCAGKHYVASALRAEAAKRRGYEVKDDEVSDRMVSKVVGLIQGAAEVDIDLSSGYVSAVVGKRLYIAYLVAS